MWIVGRNSENKPSVYQNQSKMTQETFFTHDSASANDKHEPCELMLEYNSVSKMIREKIEVEYITTNAHATCRWVVLSCQSVILASGDSHSNVHILFMCHLMYFPLCPFMLYFPSLDKESESVVWK